MDIAADPQGTTTTPLTGLRVIDIGVLFAGPVVATHLGDFGADVIKVEHPRGDPLRTLGWHDGDVSLWWALVSRNKRCVTLDLATGVGQEVFVELVAGADVVVESFRPGTLEGWDLGWERLHARNPRLVLVRTSGFGQTGPYRRRPGFGTLAEAMSGFAHINGAADGPPMLPPFALGDGVAALAGAVGVMLALYHRDVRGGEGQCVDVSLYEPLMSILGPQSLVYDRLGVVQGRTGNRAPFTAPRNVFRSQDGRWLALSASSRSIAERVMRLVGRGDLVAAPWFADHAGRVAHQDELEAAISDWIGSRTAEAVIDSFEQSEAAIAPVYDIAELVADPHVVARGSFVSVEDERLGRARVPNVTPRLSATPGRVHHLGPEKGSSNREVFIDELGHTPDEITKWRLEGVI